MDCRGLIWLSGGLMWTRLRTFGEYTDLARNYQLLQKEFAERDCSYSSRGRGVGVPEFELFAVTSVFMRIDFGLIVHRQQTEPQRLTHTTQHTLTYSLLLCCSTAGTSQLNCALRCHRNKGRSPDVAARERSNADRHRVACKLVLWRCAQYDRRFGCLYRATVLLLWSGGHFSWNIWKILNNNNNNNIFAIIAKI